MYNLVKLYTIVLFLTKKLCVFYCLYLGYDRKEKMSSAINPQMDKWEMSLMSSLNFSQLFLHLMTLGMKNLFVHIVLILEII